MATARLAALGDLRRERFERAIALLNQRANAVFAGVSGGSLRISTTGDSFHGGCVVTVSAPGKRARDAGMLSGGEQALVAVAMAIGAIVVSRVMAKDVVNAEDVGLDAMGEAEEAKEGEERGTGARATDNLGTSIHDEEEGVILVDEVDAAMDSGNVRRVGAMLRERARRGGQCLCVSLKEGLYAQADALVGIYRDQDGGSRVLTLDLNSFREE